MKILQKEGDEYHLLALPYEESNPGDYLIIEDNRVGKNLIIQVMEVKYANIPGMFEEILRDGLSNRLEGDELDPLNVNSQLLILKDTKLTVCKVRGVLEKGKPTPYGSFVPSRNYSAINPLAIEKLLYEERLNRPIEVGETVKKDRIFVDAEALDGRLNIITGRKGTGKSHLSKILILGLVEYGAPCLVLDINGEYVNLSSTKIGEPQERFEDKIVPLTPGRNLKFNMEKMGLSPILNMLIYALDLPWNSTRAFVRIWKENARNGKLTLEGLNGTLTRWKCHESIREAIQSRLYTMMDSDIFTDDPSDTVNIPELFRSIRDGGAIIVNLRDQSAITRRMLVELLLGKLKELLSKGVISPMFIFAEEAHLYLRDTYWDDIVTRMRHLGLFATFITNQPSSIQETIYRQVDNIFLFNFLNDKDLEAISRVAKIDTESVKLIVKELPPRHCLVIGDVVQNFPLVVKVRSLDVDTMGETRYFFKTGVSNPIPHQRLLTNSSHQY
ncbi:MAG: ATP-binding protein [Candidatus Bathyarchaeia archaeon]